VAEAAVFVLICLKCPEYGLSRTAFEVVLEPGHVKEASVSIDKRPGTGENLIIHSLSLLG